MESIPREAALPRMVNALQTKPQVKAPVLRVQRVTMRFPVTKSYRELLTQPFRRRQTFTALQSVSLTIEPGDRVAVLGPNGAGKTTLLKLIGGLLLPTEGTIEVNGFDTWKHNSAARRSVGFVMNEERSFFWRLTATQNLEFFAALDNLWGCPMKERSRDLIRFVGLEEHSEKPVSTFSSGMKQRLALARGLIAEPRVLILDEPTRTLDPVACDELVEMLGKRIHEDSRKTLLIATHRLEEAVKLCDKVLIINEGRIKAFDRISDLSARGLSLAEYYRCNVAAKNHD